jgi:hypothetical protein
MPAIAAVTAKKVEATTTLVGTIIQFPPQAHVEMRSRRARAGGCSVTVTGVA